MTKLVIVLTLFCAVACATPYQPVGTAGGFYHRQISENHYVIGFNGNGFTERHQAGDFALLRAAEIGYRLGFSHMVLRGSSDRSKTSYINNGTTTNHQAHISQSGNRLNYYGQSTTTSNQIPVFKPGIKVDVMYFEGIPTGRHLDVYRIDFTIRKLARHYEVDELLELTEVNR